MTDAEIGQVNQSAAEVYEDFFVPALFLEWASRVADAARLSPGQRVLDVACGTGVLAREAAGRVRPNGGVIGLDRNEGMLEVARRQTSDTEWRLGRAEALPFPSRSFDAVISQFGLMFFEDRIAALEEMFRVLPPGGRLAIAVWDAMENVPGYAAMTDLLRDMFGDRVLEACNAPFNLGDVDLLRSILSEAGLADARIETQAGTVHFPSIEAWVHTDVKGWTLADMIDDTQYRALQDRACVEMKSFQKRDGTVAFQSSAHIVTALKA